MISKWKRSADAVSDDFNLPATIAMLVLFLIFFSATFYVLIASYLDLS